MDLIHQGDGDSSHLLSAISSKLSIVKSMDSQVLPDGESFSLPDIQEGRIEALQEEMRYLD